MAFQVRTSLDPAASAAKWATKVQSAGADLLAGYSKPRRDPQANPDRSANTWLSNTQAAKGRYQSGIAGYDSAAAVDSMAKNGVSRYTQSATTKIRKVQTFHQNYDSVISAGMNQLPTDRSSFEARKARSNAMQDYLHAHPYKKSA